MPKFITRIVVGLVVLIPTYGETLSRLVTEGLQSQGFSTVARSWIGVNLPSFVFVTCIVHELYISSSCGINPMQTQHSVLLYIALTACRMMELSQNNVFAEKGRKRKEGKKENDKSGIIKVKQFGTLVILPQLLTFPILLATRKNTR